MGEIAYVNGQLVPFLEAKISIFDRGFLYGDGLFETLRIYHNVPFLLEKHLARLGSSARNLKINCPLQGELESGVCSVLEANQIEDGVLKIVLTRGVGERGLEFSKDATSSLVITATPGIPYTKSMYEQGVSVVFVPETRSFGHLKSLNLLANVMAKSYARSRGAQEAIFVKEDFVIEGTTSNVFAVSEGRLITPPLDHMILPGITREHVLNLTDDLGLDSCESNLSKRELEESSEVFITNSVLEIMPVVRLEEKKIGNGHPGEIALALREKYHKSINMH